MWTAQDKVLAIVPKFSGFLSLCGSTYIVQHVLLSKERRNFVYHRILCAMSCSDILGSSMYVLSTWPIPKGYAVYAIGNQASCNFSGTLDQFASLTTPLFSGSLAVYYLVVIRYGWREERVRQHQVWFFAIPFLLGASTAIAGLFMKLYNPADWVCWIAPFPPGCEDDSPTNPCTRGINADLYRMVFSYVIVWIVFGVLALSMLLIYRKVRATELKTQRYKSSSFLSQPSSQALAFGAHNHNKNKQQQQEVVVSNPQPQQSKTNPSSVEQRQESGDDDDDDDDSSAITDNPQPKGAVLQVTSSSSRPPPPSSPPSPSPSPRPPPPPEKPSLSRTVMNQALLYMGAFYLTFIFGTIARLLQIWNITLYPIFVCMTIFFPLQGFWQFLIYTRPARQKKQHQQQKRKQQQEQQQQEQEHKNHHPHHHNLQSDDSDESSSTYTQNPLLCIDVFKTSSVGGNNNHHLQRPTSSLLAGGVVDVGGSLEPQLASTVAADSLVYANNQTFDNAESELEYISSQVA